MVLEIESLNINNAGKGCWCFISHPFMLIRLSACLFLRPSAADRNISAELV